jgi:hypothetical protein
VQLRSSQVLDGTRAWDSRTRRRRCTRRPSLHFNGLNAEQPDVLSSFAWVYGRAGRKHEAQRLIDELNEIARHRYVGAALFVSAYLGIGDKDAALTWMERGIEEQDQGWVSPKVDPSLDPLRSEPRFQALMRRIDFPQ